MSMISDLRVQLTQAMKDKDERKKSALRMLISEIERQPACGTDHAQIQLEFKTAKKLIEGNSETLAVMPSTDPRYAALTWENEFYNALLPVTLTVTEIVTILREVETDIKAAKDTGPATGVAMKLLRSKNIANAQGQDVQEAVKQIRGG